MVAEPQGNFPELNPLPQTTELTPPDLLQWKQASVEIQQARDAKKNTSKIYDKFFSSLLQSENPGEELTQQEITDKLLHNDSVLSLAGRDGNVRKNLLRYVNNLYDTVGNDALETATAKYSAVETIYTQALKSGSVKEKWARTKIKESKRAFILDAIGDEPDQINEWISRGGQTAEDVKTIAQELSQEYQLDLLGSSTPSSVQETGETKTGIEQFSTDELSAELVKRGFSVLGPSTESAAPVVDDSPKITNLDDVGEQKPQEVKESITTQVGRENFQRQVQQGLSDTVPPVATEISDTLSSPLQVDRMVASTPGFGGVSTPLATGNAAPPAPSVDAGVNTSKPTEDEYSQKLASAADALTTFRAGLGQNNALSTSQGVSPVNESTKPTEDAYTAALGAAAVGAEDFRQKLGQNYVSPNPPTPTNYADTLAAAANDLTQFRTSLGQNNALSESPAPQPEAGVAVLEKKTDDEQVQRILEQSREKAREKVGGMKTRIGLAIGAAIFGVGLFKDAHAPGVDLTGVSSSSQGIEAPAPLIDNTDKPYTLPGEGQGALASSDTTTESTSAGDTAPVADISPAEPVTSPDNLTDAVVPGVGETNESELPDATMVEVAIDKPGDSISQSMQDENNMNVEDFNEKYYQDPQIMTGIVLYNWEEFQEAWKGKDGFPTSLEEYMQLVIKADGGDAEAQAKLLEITQHGASMVEQGQEYYVPATPQDGKEVYQDLVQSYKEDPGSFSSLLHEIEESKKEEEEGNTADTTQPESIVNTSSVTQTTPASTTPLASTSPLGALATAAGGAGDGVSHEPLSPLASVSPTASEATTPAATTQMASTVSTAGIPAQAPVEQQVQTPVQQRKKLFGIF